MPQISVIVPVYNVENYIHRCIDSILNQTFTDFELILVDDGSPDNSGTICDEYAAKDDRVKVIHKPNGGVSSARNVGIDAACGKYVMFCDSDDYVEPRWCEHMVMQIEKHPYSWCFCGCHCVDANETMVHENCVFHTEPETEILPMRYYDEVYRTNYSALLWIRIFNLDVIRKHSIRFDERMSVSEDVLFALEYGRYCRGFAVVNLPLYNHRVYLNNEVDHLDGKLPTDMFYTNKRIYEARKHLIPEEKRNGFDTDFFYRFLEDIRKLVQVSKESKRVKIIKIREILKSPEFRTVIQNADTSKENWKSLLVLRIGSARIVWILFGGK